LGKKKSKPNYKTKAVIRCFSQLIHYAFNGVISLVLVELLWIYSGINEIHVPV